MQNANKGEQAARRLLINIGFAIEALLQDPRAFVVNSAPGHVDGFNLAGREGSSPLQSSFRKFENSLLPPGGRGQGTGEIQRPSLSLLW